jgi:hypothetical protein
MNTRPMRRLGISRQGLFESVERAALRPLPASEYEYAEWRKARVIIDYQVEAEDFFYSVPHPLIREEVELRITQRVIEVFHKGKRVAAHPRRYGGNPHLGRASGNIVRFSGNLQLSSPNSPIIAALPDAYCMHCAGGLSRFVSREIAT